MASTQQLTAVAQTGGTLKQVLAAFSSFQVARNEFVNALSGFLAKEDAQHVTLEALMKNDVMAVLCCPLAQDCIPGIQSQALQCLSKLAVADPLISQVVVSCGALDSVVVSLSHEHAPVQASASCVLAAVSNSSVEYAQRVLAAGTLPHLIKQLQEGSPSVKESAVKTLTALIQSSPQHAAMICNDNNLTLLISLLQAQGSSPSLLQALLQCLSGVAAGGQRLAETLTRLQALQPLTQMVRGSNTPPFIKAAALNTLAQAARHHDELANSVANLGVLPTAVQLLTDTMAPAIRRNAGALLLQCTQKTPDLAELVAKAGAPAALKKFMALEKDSKQGMLTGIMITGTLSSYKAAVARAVVEGGAGQPVIDSIGHADFEITGAAAWAVEQMAQHGELITGTLIEQGALKQLVDAHPRVATQKKNPELQRKVKQATKAVIRAAATSESLEPFVDASTPPNILKHLLRKLEVLLARSPMGRQSFVTSGALQRLQKLKKKMPEKVVESMTAINSMFPEDVVRYYSGA